MGLSERVTEEQPTETCSTSSMSYVDEGSKKGEKLLEAGLERKEWPTPFRTSKVSEHKIQKQLFNTWGLY